MKKLKKSNSRPKRKFTLIELLVVISIVAILAGLLLPALNQARAKGRAVACLSNEREIGKLFFFYAQDYHDYMPMSYGLTGTDGKVLVRSWLQSINPMLNRTNWKQISKAGKLMICQELASKVKPDENGESDTTYTYNRRLGDLDYCKKGIAGYHPRKVSSAKFPTRFATLMEGIYDGERMTVVTAASDIDHLSHPHFRRNNQLFADGHAEAVNMYKSYTDWRAWCLPYSYMPDRHWDDKSSQW